MALRAIDGRNVVESGQAGFGLDTLIADMAVRCLDRQLAQISIHDLPSRTIRKIGRQARVLAMSAIRLRADVRPRVSAFADGKMKSKEGQSCPWPPVAPLGGSITFSDACVNPVVYLLVNLPDSAASQAYPLGELRISFKPGDMRRRIQNHLSHLLL